MKLEWVNVDLHLKKNLSGEVEQSNKVTQTEAMKTKKVRLLS